MTNGAPRGGSTDMGDVNHIMPAIQPNAKGASGTCHGAETTASVRS